MNKTSLAKAIAIVMGTIISAIAILTVIKMYPFMGLVILYATMVSFVIGMFVYIVYEQIEYNKEYKK